MEGNLELEIEKNNVREDHYIIIITKQFVMQEAKGIPLDNKT